MQQTAWRDLFRSDDLDRARAIATCLEAMEYESAIDRRGEAISRRTTPLYVVQVHQKHWPDLVAVIDEIVVEQEEFDLFIETWHARDVSVNQRMLLVITVLVGSLAAVGLIKL